MPLAVEQFAVDFLSNRAAMNEYGEALDEMFYYYVKSEQYASMSAQQREKRVDLIIELKQFLKNAEKAKQVQALSEGK